MPRRARSRPNPRSSEEGEPPIGFDESDREERHAASPQVEYAYQCPHCWAPISTIIDLSVRHQRYTEDCEVCCQPVEIDCVVSPNGVEHFSCEAQ